MSGIRKLPYEILFRIGQYLDQRQLASCVLVSTCWNKVFGALLWSDITFAIKKRTGQIPSEILLGKAHWMRSIVFDGIYPTNLFVLGGQCFRLRSLELSLSQKLERGHNKAFKDIVKQNCETLASLTLSNMYSPYTRHRREYPNWSPLLGLAHPSHSALRTLRLIGYYLPDRHLWAFWAICERLEVLEMEGVDFKMPHIMVPGARKLNASPNPNSLGSKHQDVVMRFPKLRELKLIESSPTNGLAQLEGIIRQCPNLTTLHWKVRQYGYFPRTRLIYLFTGIQGNYIPLDFQHSIQLLRCASPSWPRLTSITIERHPHEAFNLEDYLTIAQTVKGLRKLELGVLAIEPNVVQTLLARHSIRFARSICEICAMKVFPNGS